MKRLNVKKLNSRIDKVVSSEEALSEIVPIDWPEDIINGNKKVCVANIVKEECSNVIRYSCKFL